MRDEVLRGGMGWDRGERSASGEVAARTRLCSGLVCTYALVIVEFVVPVVQVTCQVYFLCCPEGRLGSLVHLPDLDSPHQGRIDSAIHPTLRSSSGRQHLDEVLRRSASLTYLVILDWEYNESVGSWPTTPAAGPHKLAVCTLQPVEISMTNAPTHIKIVFSCSGPVEFGWVNVGLTGLTSWPVGLG